MAGYTIYKKLAYSSSDVPCSRELMKCTEFLMTTAANPEVIPIRIPKNEIN